MKNKDQFPYKSTLTYACILFYIIMGTSCLKAQEVNKINTKTNALLEKIMDTDQILREECYSLLDKYGNNSPEYKLADRKLTIGDSINQKQIDSIFDKHGWLYPPIVSQKATEAYFYVIQHAPYEFQNKYRDHVIDAYKKNVINENEYCIFMDRIAIREQKYQKYGTQIMRDNIGNNYFVPIDSANNPIKYSFDTTIKERAKENFIIFSDHNYVTLFIHTFNANTNQAVPFLEISLDGDKIGKTNEKGFFQTQIKRNKDESTLIITDTKTGKNITTKLKYSDQIDYFDRYYSFR